MMCACFDGESRGVLLTQLHDGGCAGVYVRWITQTSSVQALRKSITDFQPEGLDRCMASVTLDTSIVSFSTPCLKDALVTCTWAAVGQLRAHKDGVAGRHVM